MSKANTLSLSRIQTLFRSEVENLGGTMRDTFADGTRLFARAVLPLYRDVRRNDTMQCGIALRAREDVICVHPYLFRLVCTNGAITAHAVQSRRIGNAGAQPVEETETTLIAALQECGSKEAFASGIDEVRSSLDIEADAILTLMPFLSQLPAATQSRLLMDILDNHHAERDMSGFGLMNAITATARDTDDPDLRWNLEEYGGGIPALLLSQPALRRGGAVSPDRMLQAFHQGTGPEWREAGRGFDRQDEHLLTTVA